MQEVRDLLSEGVREINLVAQDLTSYGSDFKGAAQSSTKSRDKLVNLLRGIELLKSEHEQFWLRLLYAYPVGVTKELIETIAESEVVCNYLDLPLQHISSSVLKQMHRPLWREKNP